jgi:hypothetical protein
MNLSMETKSHPGQVVFWDGNTNKIVRTASASELPIQMLWAETKEGKVAVVKVIATTFGDQRHVLEYGPENQLLRSTTQILQ